MIELDQDLIRRAKRAPRKDELTEGERIAMNLFWRKGVRVPVLARIFQVSKNTCYYNCLTGEGSSYPRSGLALATNARIDAMGEAAAWRHYVTPQMIAAVNAVNEELALFNTPRA